MEASNTATHQLIFRIACPPNMQCLRYAIAPLRRKVMPANGKGTFIQYL